MTRYEDAAQMLKQIRATYGNVTLKVIRQENPPRLTYVLRGERQLPGDSRWDQPMAWGRSAYAVIEKFWDRAL